MTLKLHGIEACVFDAYGTLFDVNSAARAAQDSLGEKWQPLAELWRVKQLQYTWLRGLGERHADFWQVTGDALDFAMSTLQVEDYRAPFPADEPVLGSECLSGGAGYSNATEGCRYEACYSLERNACHVESSCHYGWNC